ncbi:hypothetical protein CVT24_007361 [Panaeolus cyanescens]|uniref:Uncharacterized protein n=1 Tax=Panaeolus cyanescens TaxID=181874 RepID=A0A409YL62_9AGAR|nr:hypothetical protein CVT24_007361 [Panaeolus cyanescens]
MSSQWAADESRVGLVSEEGKIKTKVRSIWQGFLNFALRDNVLEVAVGLIAKLTNVTIPCSAFIYKIISFIGIGLVLYLIANLYGYISKDSIIRHATKCPYCRKEISPKAKRCPTCTSWLDGREEKESSSIPPHDDD